MSAMPAIGLHVDDADFSPLIRYAIMLFMLPRLLFHAPLRCRAILWHLLPANAIMMLPPLRARG